MFVEITFMRTFRTERVESQHTPRGDVAHPRGVVGLYICLIRLYLLAPRILSNFESVSGSESGRIFPGSVIVMVTIV